MSNNKKFEVIKKLVKEFIIRYKEELLFAGITDKKGIDAQLEYLKFCNGYLSNLDFNNAFRLINHIDFQLIAKTSKENEAVDKVYFEFEKNIAKILLIQELRTKLILGLSQPQPPQMLN